MTFRAVVFDLDGTLLDTLTDLADALNCVLRDKGLPTHSIDVIRYFIGNGPATLVALALPPEKQNDELKADCLAAFRREYSRNWNRRTQPYSGIPALLDGLTGSNTALAVCTNKPQHYAELCIEEFLSAWKFAVILGQRDGIPMKPDPGGPREIARGLSIPAQECLFLGDSEVDMKTAVNAGMFPVGAMWGFRTEKELRDAGAAEVIGEPTQLLTLMG